MRIPLHEAEGGLTGKLGAALAERVERKPEVSLGRGVDRLARHLEPVAVTVLGHAPCCILKPVALRGPKNPIPKRPQSPQGVNG